MYFYRQLLITGKWSPRISKEKPATQSADGRKTVIKDLQEIPDEIASIDLPVDGVARILDDARDPEVSEISVERTLMP